MSNPIVLNLAAGKKDDPRAPRSNLAMVWDGMTALARRVIALETRPAPKDGRGVVKTLINSEGHLVLTFTDGAVETVGRVVGEKGKDATLLEAEEARKLVSELANVRATLDAIEAKQEEPAPPLATPEDGKPGTGIAAAAIDAAGNLTMTLSDGRELKLGRVVGDSANADYIASLERRIVQLSETVAALAARPAPEAPPVQQPKEGVGIAGANVQDGNLRLTLTDGRVLEAGRVAGRDADPPAPVKDGIGISAAGIGGDGHLRMTLSDGRAFDVGRVVGRDAESYDGDDGDDGDDGVGIAGARIDDAGDLHLTLSNGNVINAGRVRGRDGEPGKPGAAAEPQPIYPEPQDGIGIAGARVDENGNLIITLSDGQEINAGVVKGTNGTDSVGIKAAAIDEDGNLEIALSDGKTINAGRAKGDPGRPGAPGKPGTPGAPGGPGPAGQVPLEIIGFDPAGQLNEQSLQTCELRIGDQSMRVLIIP